MVSKIDGNREVVQPKPAAKPAAPVVKRPVVADDMSTGKGRALRVAAEKSLNATPFSATAPIAPAAGTFKVSASGTLTPSGTTSIYTSRAGSVAAAMNDQILKNPVNTCPYTPPLSAADQKSAEDAVGTEDPGKIADWLSAHPDPVTQRAFWAEYKGFLPTVLDKSDTCTDAQKAALSSSLDVAYKSGDVTDDDIKAMVGDDFRPRGDGPLGAIIGGTHDPALINTFANEELKHMGGDSPWRDQAVAAALAGMPADGMRAYLSQHPTLVHDLLNTPDPASARSAAEVLGHLPPDMLQSWLADPANKDDKAKLLSNINKDDSSVALDDEDSSSVNSPAFGDLLKNAANIQPPTPEVTDLFTQAVDLTKDNPASLQGLAALYVKDAPQLTAALTADGNSAGPTVLSKFFAQTLFSPDVQDVDFDGGGKLTDAITGAIKNASNSLQAQFGGDQQHDAGRQLGRLAASLEGAAAVTLKDYRDQVAGNKEKRDLFAGLIGKAIGAALPDELIGKDFAVDKVSELIAGVLVKDPSKPGTISLRSVWEDQFEAATSAYDEAHGKDSTLTTDYDGAYAKAAIDIHDQLGINFDGTSAG
ncbi:MAG: hypothetical protein QM723_12125 [Myxococcaceae bacterium]